MKIGMQDRYGREIREDDILLINWKDNISGYEGMEKFRVVYLDWAWQFIPLNPREEVYPVFVRRYKNLTEFLEVIE